jgi:DNA topoisomerase-1
VDLVILESPNKVKDVQKYAAQLGFNCQVTATFGHMLDLPPMAEGACIDMANFTPTRLEPREHGSSERIRKIQAVIKAADRVIVASDPDREGEAIAAQVWPWIPAGKAYRATFEEITLHGVECGLKAMRPHLNDRAVDTATARRCIDRLAGWHATSVVFEKLRTHKGISAGRLQSAALRLVVDRFREHESFVPTSTFSIRLKLRTQTGAVFTAKVIGEDGSAMVSDSRAKAQEFKMPNAAAVRVITSERKAQKPRPPFEATAWLQVAQKALGLSVKEATSAIQGLFEEGHTTYPRTDTVRVSADAVGWARSEIQRRFGAAYLPDKPWEHKDRGTVQGAHEAIRPTLPHAAADLEIRSEGQWSRAYALIEARFLASQAAARIVDHTTVDIDAEGVRLEASGQVEVFDGWKRILATNAAEEDVEKPSPGTRGAHEDDVSSSLPALREGEQLIVVSSEIVTNTTKPQPLFSQAGLVAELKRLGIGRPSTYPSIVPLLLSRGWVTERAPATSKKSKKKDLLVLCPEPVGIALADFLKEEMPGLVDYAFTAQLEEQLDRIESGEAPRLEVVSSWWTRFEKELRAAKEAKPRLPERKDLGPCPKCVAAGRSGHLRLVKGVSTKTGAAYEFAACDQDSKDHNVCGHTAPTENGELQKLAPCPECQTDMRPIRFKSGGHAWRCDTHGWFLADKRWRIVSAPECPKCQQPMVHRERTQHKGEYFWACFACAAFHTSDAFGAVLDDKRKAKR